MSKIIFLLVVCIAVACGETNSSESNGEDEYEYEAGANHPVPESIPDDEEVDHVVGPDRKVGDSESLNEYASRLRDARLAMKIGKKEGDRHEVFGRIKDMASSSRGEIYVLDSEYGEVRRYAKDGEYKESFGRPGNGPGEFRDPIGVDLVDDDEVDVLDKRGEVELYREKNGHIKHRKTLRATSRVRDMCTLGNKGFFRGYREGRDTAVVHAYSLQDGSYVRSFGEPYQEGSFTMRSRLSEQGRIGCAEKAGMVITSFLNLPLILGYNPKGDMKWRTKISGFNSRRIIQTKTGSVKWMGIEQGEEHNTMEVITDADGNFFIAQVLVLTLDDEGERKYKVDTYVFSSISGEGVYVGNDFPLIYSVSNNIVLSTFGLPFPHIEVYLLDKM